MGFSYISMLENLSGSARARETHHLRRGLLKWPKTTLGREDSHQHFIHQVS